MLDLPPDPLLSSDSFIKSHPDRDTAADETLIVTSDPNSTTAAGETLIVTSDPAQPEILEPNTATAVEVIEVDDLPASSEVPAITPKKRGRRKKSDQIDLPNATISSERPDWLPDGWYVEDRVRVSGATAGHVDKYFCDPVSGNKFRSSLEVTRFQETGSKKKQKNATTGTPVKGGSSSQRKKKSASKTINNPAPNFDFANVPDTIGWVLNDSSENSWTPVVGNVMVDENTKNEWAITFTSLATKKIN